MKMSYHARYLDRMSASDLRLTDPILLGDASQWTDEDLDEAFRNLKDTINPNYVGIVIFMTAGSTATAVRAAFRCPGDRGAVFKDLDAPAMVGTNPIPLWRARHEIEAYGPPSAERVASIKSLEDAVNKVLAAHDKFLADMRQIADFMAHLNEKKATPDYNRGAEDDPMQS